MEQKMSDIELAVELTAHIEHPCEVEVNGNIHNIRDFYIREAKRVLPALTNPHARDLLQMHIDKYNLPTPS